MRRETKRFFTAVLTKQRVAGVVVVASIQWRSRQMEDDTRASCGDCVAVSSSAKGQLQWDRPSLINLGPAALM